MNKQGAFVSDVSKHYRYYFSQKERLIPKIDFSKIDSSFLNECGYISLSTKLSILLCARLLAGKDAKIETLEDSQRMISSFNYTKPQITKFVGDTLLDMPICGKEKIDFIFCLHFVERLSYCTETKESNLVFILGEAGAFRVEDGFFRFGEIHFKLIYNEVVKVPKLLVIAKKGIIASTIRLLNRNQRSALNAKDCYKFYDFSRKPINYITTFGDLFLLIFDLNKKIENDISLNAL